MTILKKIWEVIKIVFFVIWGLPQNLVGGIIYLVCACKKREHEIYRGRVMTLWGLGSGLSLGYFTFVSTYAGDNTKNHEFGHTLQSMLLGPLYLLVIGLPSLIWAACFEEYRRKNGISYYSLYTEKWADKWGGVERRY